jgi:hypothetical protein
VRSKSDNTFGNYYNLREKGTLMKTRGELMAVVILGGICLMVAGALAGESGEVTCTSCGYKTQLNIGGLMKSPSVTGYCAKEKKFVQVKLKSHDDYYQPQRCPHDRQPLEPIYQGADVSRIPCPQCGKPTLKYELELRQD